jgi:hypothetical protein
MSLRTIPTPRRKIQPNDRELLPCYFIGMGLEISAFLSSSNQLTLMRLLEYNSNGTFSLIEFVGSDVPPYAILSHT